MRRENVHFFNRGQFHSGGTDRKRYELFGEQREILHTGVAVDSGSGDRGRGNITNFQAVLNAKDFGVGIFINLQAGQGGSLRLLLPAASPSATPTSLLY
jgi:hypothetical protein